MSGLQLLDKFKKRGFDMKKKQRKPLQIEQEPQLSVKISKTLGQNSELKNLEELKRFSKFNSVPKEELSKESQNELQKFQKAPILAMSIK